MLLLQQLLVEAMDLLDPLAVRVPMSRRIKISPVAHAPLPNWEEYRQRIFDLEGVVMTGGVASVVGGGGSEGGGSRGPVRIDTLSSSSMSDSELSP